MANKTTGIIYQLVIDEVISAVQREFEDHGVDESVLQELQRSWEAKLIESRVAEFPHAVGEETYYEEPEPTLPYDQDYQPPPNLPAAEEPYNSAYIPSLGQVLPAGPTAAASLVSLASSASAASRSGVPPSSGGPAHPQTTHSAASAGGVPSSTLGSADGVPPSAYPAGTDPEYGRPQPFMQPRAPPSGGGGSGEPPANGTGGHIPQHDGADDDERPSAPSTIRFTAYIPQVDGDFDDGLEPEADEDAINSDLDDSDDEEANTDQAGGEDTEHIILCQYDKVGRQKNRWKCVLKDGILLIDGKDYLFHKATGEFEW
ncbi:transcription factor IIA subunit alpha [Dimargaris cristalligena]|nr:transcription factor IIA subunit alpha [Dimargaris cristalligena]